MSRRLGNPVSGVVIRHLILRQFGRVEQYAVSLAPGLNHLTTDHPADVVAAVRVLLGGVAPSAAVREDTYLCACVQLEGECLQVQARPSRHRPPWLMVTATDEKGRDVSRRYQQAVRLCALQERALWFDGEDASVAECLCYYRRYEEKPQPTPRSHIVNTNFFRGHLLRYLHRWEPVRYDRQRDHWLSVDSRGCLVPVDRWGNPMTLPASEQWLFRGACFLCVLAFWDAVAEECDLHYLKRPLLLYRFWEHLDEAEREAMTDTLLEQGRQVLLLGEAD